MGYKQKLPETSGSLNRWYLFLQISRNKIRSTHPGALDYRKDGEQKTGEDRRFKTSHHSLALPILLSL
jgi:hypothetical protein